MNIRDKNSNSVRHNVEGAPVAKHHTIKPRRKVEANLHVFFASAEVRSLLREIFVIYRVN